MTKKTTSERLKQLMAERNLRQVDILEKAQPYCAKFGVKLGRNDISQYVSGKVLPKQDKLTVLAYALNVNEAWLMGYDVSPERESSAATIHTNASNSKVYWMDRLNEIVNKITDEYFSSIENLPADAFAYSSGETRMIPVLGAVNCGEAMFADDNIEGYIDTALSDAPESDEFFWMKAKGNSMINAGISEGDALLIRQQSDVDSGDIAVVAVGDNEATLKRVKKQDGAIILQAENPAYEPRIFFGDNAKDVRIIGRLMQLRKKF